MNIDALRKAENEKKSFQLKSEKDIYTLKKEFEAKTEKYRTDISRLENEIKQKEELITNFNFSNEKQCLLYTQKVIFPYFRLSF